MVEALAGDEMEGRDNGSDGSTLAQDFLVDQLGQFTDPLDGDSLEGYGHTFALGTNLIGVIPGGDRAEEYVVLGAHYDHLGWGSCGTDTPDDLVCNGAGDDASGVATVLEIGRSLAADPEPPPRTVVLALWDAEEDGLAGSAAYVDDPPVPLEDTVVYLNWDIQGSNLSPALADSTVMIGAETGGPNLIAAAQAATEDSSLQTLALSLGFGEWAHQRPRHLRGRGVPDGVLHRWHHALLPHAPGRRVHPRLRQAGPADPHRHGPDPGPGGHRRPAGVRRHDATGHLRRRRLHARRG